MWGNKALNDLCKIAKVVGLEPDPEQVLKQLAELAFQAILELGDDTSWSEEFQKLFVFMYHNRVEIMERYGPHLFDEDFIVEKKYETMMTDNLVKGLLVTLAKLYPNEEEDIPEANSSILPVMAKEKKK